MMRGQSALATSVLPTPPAVMPGPTSSPNFPADADWRATEIKPAVRANSRTDPRVGSPQVSMTDSSAISMTALPRRRIGVFLAALLVFDAGLAIAGALMMRSALVRGQAPSSSAPAAVVPAPADGAPSGTVDAPQPVPPTVQQPTQQPAMNAVAGRTAVVSNATVPVEPAAIPAGGAGAGSAMTGALSGAGANVQISPQPPAVADKGEKASPKNSDKKVTGSGPVDPYATPLSPLPPVPAPEPAPTPSGNEESAGTLPAPMPVPTGDQTAQEESLADQVRRREVGSRARFARCYSTAAKASDVPLVGAVTVAFQVTPQGRVSNASAVDNSTESLSLARCVVAEVGKWTFASDGAAAQDFVRVFKFEGQ